MVARIAQEQLPDARRQPGFSGFYFLVDRAAGKLVTISLWESHDDVRAVESRAAQLRGAAATEIGVTTPAVDILEVAVRA